MAATKKQGQWFGLFLAGLTTACAGLAGFSSGLGKVALLLGVIVLAASAFTFMKIKPLEGKVANGAQPAAMKLLGVLLAILGWGVALFGLHLTDSVSGRMIIALIGMAITLTGVIGVLPVACNKNAIWKA